MRASSRRRRVRAFYNEIEPYAAAWLENLVRAGLIARGTVERRSIVDLTPDDLHGYRQAHFFAGIGVWSHALRLAGWPDDVPIWTGSCPCFAAGTLVLTSHGMKPIEEVRVGDSVLTHRGRWRPVTATMRTERRETVVVKGQGHWGLETTSEHPFLTDAAPTTWTEAAELAGKRWACVRELPPTTVPPFPAKDWKGRPAHLPEVSLAFWRFVGYWLGDGWCRRGTVFLCGSKTDGSLLADLASAAGLRFAVREERTGCRLRAHSKLLALWLTEHFGAGAATKRIPTWLLGLADEDVKRAFLDGLFLADGHTQSQKNGAENWVLTTTSRTLAVGVRILANQLQCSASMGWTKPRRERCVIEGREVNERGFYRVTVYRSARSFQFRDGYGWGRVRKVLPGRCATVYNIAVEEDESYVADGIVVHNCQPFSSAGAQRGFDDERHLWPRWFDLIRACRPPCIVGEQVSSPAGLAWFDAVQADLEGAGYTCRALDLCAAGVGAPHIRQRLYFVALADGQRLEGLSLRLRQRRSLQALLEARRRGEASSVEHSALVRERALDGLARESGELPGASRGSGLPGGLADSPVVGWDGRLGGAGPAGGREAPLAAGAARGPCNGFWSDAEWVWCRDGKWRPVGPGIPPLATVERRALEMATRTAEGVEPLRSAEVRIPQGASRSGMLKAFGNAICAPLAATFLEAVIDCILER